MLSCGGLRPSEVVHLTIPDPAEQAPLVARSVTPPSPSGRGGTTLPRQRAPRSCTVFVMTPPNEHTSDSSLSVYVALTNIPEGELLTGFAMRSDPNVAFG